MKTFKVICLIVTTALMAGGVFAQGVGINSTGASPDPSAMLDVSSTSAGVLISRMTTAQRDAISNPANGLQVYNTDSDCLNIWNGATWRQSCYECDFPAPAVSNNSPICEGNTLSFTATNIPGATYAWSGPNGFVSTQQNPSISNVTSSASGLYSLVVTLNGCSGTPVTTTVTINPSPQTPVAGNSGPLCVGDNLSLTASTIAGATYSWSGPNGFTANTQNPSYSNVSLNNAGVYSVDATVNGCTGAAGTTTVVVNSIPATPGSITGDAAPCGGSNGVTYSISAVAGATTYTWSAPSGASIVTGQGSTSISINWGTTSGNVCVSAGNTCGSSSTSCLAVNLQGVGGSQTFSFTGASQTFTVPSCVSSITMEVWGGAGGGTITGSSQKAGSGGYSKGTLAVTPGETFYVYVGGQGEFQGNNGPNPLAAGGWNGGGWSGACQASAHPAGGGGGSDVRFGGQALTNRIIIAGGGGGAYADYSAARTGGNGGGLTGADCPSGSSDCGGGSQTAGGSGGYQSGSLGQGGNDGDGVYNHDCGGGGGGGYYGGGGMNHGAGGGGSGYISGHSGCVPATHSSGKVFTATQMQSGVRNAAPGQVIFTW